MTKIKVSKQPLACCTISGPLADQLILGLVGVLKDGDPIAPSEFIELVDAVIDYFGSIDETSGLTTDRLDDLRDARADYRGPGLRW